jgi:hypothetical protein
LAGSRILGPVDDNPVWSISCFFVKKEYRRKGLSLPLLKAAVGFAFSNGAGIVEGYPVEAGPQDGGRGAIPDVFAWTGLAATFLAAGFAEVARRSPRRPVMRLSRN